MAAFTPEEHKLFQEALEKYGDGASGTEWASIVAHCRKTELEVRRPTLRTNRGSARSPQWVCQAARKACCDCWGTKLKKLQEQEDFISELCVR